MLASFISYADTDYLKFYAKKLVWLLPISIVVVSLFWLDFSVAFLIYIAYTAYHTIKQQTGIAILFVKKVSFLHKLWSWSGIFAYAYGFTFVSLALLDLNLSSFINLELMSITAAIYLIFTLFYLSTVGFFSDGGKYVTLTALVIFTAYFTIVLGYPFLAIFIARFVHDVTAFIFYVTHDVNRNAQFQSNFLYYFFNKSHLPLVIATPTLAVVFAAAIRYGLASWEHISLLLILLGFVHYFIEGFMWKRDSLHRQYVSVQVK